MNTTIQKRITPEMVRQAKIRYRFLQKRYDRLARIIDNATDYPREAYYEIRELCKLCDDLAKCSQIIQEEVTEFLTSDCEVE